MTKNITKITLTVPISEHKICLLNNVLGQIIENENILTNLEVWKYLRGAKMIPLQNIPQIYL